MTALKDFLQTSIPPAPPAPVKPGFLTQAKNYVTNAVSGAFKSGTQQIGKSFNEAANAKNPGQLFHAVGDLGSGAATALTSPLAPVMKPLGSGVNFVADKISDNPTVQKFANSKVGQVTGDVAENVSNYSNIAGTALGGKAAYDQIHPIFSRPPTPILDPATIPGATQALTDATSARATAAQQGVEGLNKFTSGLGSTAKDLGSTFGQTGAKIEATNPGAGLDITNNQLERLNNLKESKVFSLPENLDSETNPALNTGSKFGNIKLSPKNLEQINALDNTGKVRLSPTQTQDLITRLNKLTYDSKASGDLAVNQQTVGLTQELRQASSKAFGPEWDKSYSTYSKGIQAVNDLKDLTKAGNKYTPDETLNEVLKMGKTPEGKIILQQAIDEVKNTTGTDFSDPVKIMHQIIDSQKNLDEAQASLATAIKGANTHGTWHYIKQQGTRLPGYLIRYLIAREVFKAMNSQ